MGIREIRKGAGLTQEQLAKKIGINRATLSKYESGIIEPSLAQLNNIANALGVHFSALLPEDVLSEYFENNLDLLAIEIQQQMVDDAIADGDYDEYQKAIATRPETIEDGLIDAIIRRKSQQKLIAAYNKLNTEGQQRVIEYAEALAATGTYTPTEKPPHGNQKPHDSK